MSEPKQINDGGPAFPSDQACSSWQCRKPSAGMTLRTYAAIKLRVPESGIDWLDDMIRKAKRDELAGQALAGILAGADRVVADDELAKMSYWAADAMLAARKEKV